MESIHNSVHFFDSDTENKSIDGDPQLVDVHQIIGTNKDSKDTLFTLKDDAKTTYNKHLFTLMTGMKIFNTSDLFLKDQLVFH